MKDYAVVCHRGIDLTTFGVVKGTLWRRGLTTMHQYDAIETCLGRVLPKRIDMDVTFITCPLGPFLIRVTQEAALTTSIEIQNTSASNL